MKGNDLDSHAVPRDVVVFEGLVGLIPDEKIQRAEAKYRAKGKWSEALACYEMNEGIAKKVWDLVWRFSFEIDLLTYLGQGFAEVLEKRMDDEDMPFRKVWFEEPNRLARRLVVSPHIRTIYDPDPAHQFLFGGRGRVLLPEQYNMLGAM